MRYKKLIEDTNPVSKSQSAQSILNAATTLFLEKGYKNVTTRDIAALAGVNLGLIPYYFTSKINLAKQSCLNMMEELTRSIRYDLSSLSDAEQMYVSSVLMWHSLDGDPAASRFYYEFVEATDALDTYTLSFIASTWQVIKHYNLQVSETENSLYLTVMKAAERTLVIKLYRRELNITQQDIVEILTSNYFYNIGLPDREIARIIQTGQAYCRKCLAEV